MIGLKFSSAQPRLIPESNLKIDSNALRNYTMIDIENYSMTENCLFSQQTIGSRNALNS